MLHRVLLFPSSWGMNQSIIKKNTAIQSVVPKSFKVCAFPMYKLGNAWEMNTCTPLGNACTQEAYRLVHNCQVFISQTFPGLYMGNAQVLKLLGTTDCIAVEASVQVAYMTTVEPPITDPPRSGHSRYNGHVPCHGLKIP